MYEFSRCLVDRYLDAGLMAVEGSREQDNRAIYAAANRTGDRAQRVKELAAWIRLYKVHRVKWLKDDEVYGATFADAVAECAITLFDGWGGQQPEVPDHYALLRNYIDQVYTENSGKKRSFRSLTAKVLWCRYPLAVPIYDRFASDAITFMVKVYKAYFGVDGYQIGIEESLYDDKGRINDWMKGGPAGDDIWYYDDFYKSHQVIYKYFYPHLRSALTDRGVDADPFRVFDKILWLFGNSSLDYSLFSDPLKSYQEKGAG